MTPLAIALAVAVLALLWWAAKPLNTNHAENDEAASRGGPQNPANRPVHTWRGHHRLPLPNNQQGGNMSYAYKATDMSDGHDYTVGGFSTAKEARKYLAMSLTDNGYMTKTKAQQGAASLRTNTAVQVQGWELRINQDEQ